MRSSLRDDELILPEAAVLLSQRATRTAEIALPFSNSVRQLSRAGASRRHHHLLTDESSETCSNSVRSLSGAGTSRRHLLIDESSDDSAEKASSSSPERPIG